MANNISKRPRTAFLFQRLFLRLDGCLSAISEHTRPETPRCGHSHQKHSPASVFEAERAASFAANAFLPQPRRRSSNVRRQRGWLGRRTKERLRTPECNSSRHFHRRLPCRRFRISNRSASTYRIVRLPRIGSFGFHISNRSAQHDRRRPPPSNAGTPPRRCATHQSLTRSAGAAEAGIRDIRGNKDPHSALFASPPSSDRCDPSPEALPPRPIFRHPILWKAPHTTRPTLHQSSQRQDQP